MPAQLTALDHFQAQALLSAGHALALRRGSDAAAATFVNASELVDVQQTLGKFDEVERTLRDAIGAAERTLGRRQRHHVGAAHVPGVWLAQARTALARHLVAQASQQPLRRPLAQTQRSTAEGEAPSPR